MKKVLFALSLMLFMSAANATTIKLSVNKETVNQVNSVGHSILNANRIPHHITFRLIDEDYAKISMTNHGNQIKITDEYVKYFENDDELAAALAHQIAHGVDRREGV